MFFRLAAEICVTAAKTEWITDKAPKIYDGYLKIPVYRDKGASKLIVWSQDNASKLIVWFFQKNIITAGFLAIRSKMFVVARKASRKRGFSTKCSANAEREVRFARDRGSPKRVKRVLGVPVKCGVATICGTLNFTLRHSRNTSLRRKA